MSKQDLSDASFFFKNLTFKSRISNRQKIWLLIISPELKQSHILRKHKLMMSFLIMRFKQWRSCLGSQIQSTTWQLESFPHNGTWRQRSIFFRGQNTMLGMIHICIIFAQIKLFRDVFRSMNNKTYYKCAMRELVEVILLRGRLYEKFYRVDSIGQLCSRIETLTTKVVHDVNNWGNQHKVSNATKLYLCC